MPEEKRGTNVNEATETREEDNNITSQTSGNQQNTTSHDDLNAEIEALKAQNAQLAKDNIRFKRSIDKLTHNEKEYKKQLRSKMTDEEKAAEVEEERSKYVAGLEKRIKVMEHTEQLQSNGFSSDEAQKIANARADGDLEEETKLMNAHYAALEKQLKADYEKKVKELMKPSSSNGNGVDYNQMAKKAIEANDPLAAIHAINKGVSIRNKG